jgi:hypothetical protein
VKDCPPDAYGQISPDGRDHFPVVAAKIVAMQPPGRL